MSKNFDDAGEFTDKFMTSDLYGNYTNLLSDMIVQNNGLIAQTQAAEDETRRIGRAKNAIPIEMQTRSNSTAQRTNVHGILRLPEALKNKDYITAVRRKKLMKALLESRTEQAT